MKTENKKEIVLDYLKQCPLFHDLDKERLRWLLPHIRVRQFEREETVFRMGEPSQAMGFLLKGSLKAVAYSDNGREIGFSLIKPVQHFGELSLLDGQNRSAAVLALETSMIAFIPRKHALELMINEPSVSARMMVALAQLVRRSNQQIMLLGYQHVHSRVCALLLRSPHEPLDEGLKVLDLPPQREIASLVNTSRETVSRVISQLHEEGILTKKGRQIIINDLARLEQRVLEGRPA